MEERYRGLLEAAPDAMVVVNTKGEIVLLNVQAEKQFGYRRDELLGQKVTNIIPLGFAERLLADAQRSEQDALEQQIGTGLELLALRKDGSEFPIEIMLSPLKSTEAMLVTAAIRDISARKRAEVLLQEKIIELSRSNDDLSHFADIASHDLQEPLRMVSSYTQLLARRYKGKLDSDADEFIDFAVDGFTRMQRLLQDLLTYSRVGTKGKKLIETSSERALRHALSNLGRVIADSGAVVTHDPLPDVLADHIQLIQLFQNLVANAIKYQKAGVPTVHISAAKGPGDKWTFSVKDNGLGIGRNISTGSSGCSRGCTSARNSPAPESVWPSARRSSNGTGGASLSNRSSITARHSDLAWSGARRDQEFNRRQRHAHSGPPGRRQPR